MPVQATITFTPAPGNNVIMYRVHGTDAWIVPPGNPVTTSPFIINNLEGAVVYDFRIDSNCGMNTFQGQICPPVTNLIATNV